jgi:hypothetical protein
MYATRTPTNTILTNPLQEAALLQQPRHLLVLSFSRFSLQTQIPKMISQVLTVAERTERFLNKVDNSLDDVEIIWYRLPAFDILNDFRRLLALAKIYKVCANSVGVFVDERQLSKEYTCTTRSLNS